MDDQTIPVFCYGSNGTKQLQERVCNSTLVSYSAYVEGYRRIFAGYSTKWEGGVASIVNTNQSDDVCRGSVVFLSEQELKLLDHFEGISASGDPFSIDPSVNVYRRSWVSLLSTDSLLLSLRGQSSSTTIRAIAYIRNDDEWGSYPREAYLTACHRNISPFWPDLDGNQSLRVMDRFGKLRGEFRVTID